MKSPITISKYHSWYCLCQISLQIMLFSITYTDLRIQGSRLQGSRARTLKSLNFEIKMKVWKVLESCSRCLKVLEFNANFIVYVELQRERSKHRKTFGIKLLMLWKNSKRHRLKALFCAEWSSWKWEMCPWKSLKSPWVFCSKNGTNLVVIVHKMVWKSIDSKTLAHLVCILC